MSATKATSSCLKRMRTPIKLLVRSGPMISWSFRDVPPYFAAASKTTRTWPGLLGFRRDWIHLWKKTDVDATLWIHHCHHCRPWWISLKFQPFLLQWTSIVWLHEFAVDRVIRYGCPFAHKLDKVSKGRKSLALFLQIMREMGKIVRKVSGQSLHHAHHTSLIDVTQAIHSS